MSKHNLKAWIPVVLIVAIIFGVGSGSGCGGGGTGTSTGTSTGGNIVRYAVEASKNGALIDPDNIVEGETVQFQVAGYTATNQRIVQNSSNWAADPTGQTEGAMTSSGSYHATASGPLFTVSATANSTQYGGTAQVKPAGQALVTGRIVDGFGNFVFGAQVDFYDAGLSLVGSTIAQGNGTFRASVPATAVFFDVNRASIPAGYYKEYRYISRWFLPRPTNCMAPLPTLTNGNTTALLTDIVVPPTSNNGSSLPPPPPPSPCQ